MSKPEQVQRTDAELIRSIAREDEAALAALYDRHGAILLGFITRILNNRAEAEDVLQEIFLQVWQHAADFDHERGTAFTWLVMRTRSRAIDRLRALNLCARVAEASSEMSRGARDALDDVSIAEQREVIHRALADLTEKERHTLQLAYFEGLSQSEIASRLGEPIGTIKTRARQGLMKLRKLFSDKFANPR